MAASSTAHLTHIEYGKGEIRVTKVKKDTPSEGYSQIQEIKAQVLLQGDFTASFVHADNSLVVTTDTCKNTIYYLAKDHLNDDLEAFGVVVGRHFLREYSHVSLVTISLEQVSWNRISIDGVPHEHSFEQQRLKRTAEVVATRDRLSVVGGIANLRILKTTGSGFGGFYRCPLTTLPDIEDRILSTDVSATWKFDAQAANAGSIPYTAIFHDIHKTIVSIFCKTFSVSVQATMWEMGQKIVEMIPTITDISLDLPNLHNWHYDLARFGMDNNSKSRSQIFFPTEEPRGVIRCTISRHHTPARL